MFNIDRMAGAGYGKTPKPANTGLPAAPAVSTTFAKDRIEQC